MVAFASTRIVSRSASACVDRRRAPAPPRRLRIDSSSAGWRSRMVIACGSRSRSPGVSAPAIRPRSRAWSSAASSAGANSSLNSTSTPGVWRSCSETLSSTRPRAMRWRPARGSPPRSRPATAACAAADRGGDGSVRGWSRRWSPVRPRASTAAKPGHAIFDHRNVVLTHLPTSAATKAPSALAFALRAAASDRASRRCRLAARAARRGGRPRRCGRARGR